MDPYIRTHQCLPTIKDLYLSALCGHWVQEDLPRVMSDRDRWWEEFKGICYDHVLIMMIIIFSFKNISFNTFTITYII